MPAGAPTKYRKEYAEQARKLCLVGYTDEELAIFFEVCTSTIDNWKNKHKEFLGAIKKGKAQADGEVVDSLYNRAIGYSYEETKTTTGVSEGNPYTTRTVTKKQMAPDVGAQAFWLKNRQPDKWRDKKEVDMNAKVKKEVNYDGLSDEALDEIIDNTPEE